MENKIRVGVVDDHPLYRDGVVFALEDEPDIIVVGQGGSADDAIKIARYDQPDVLLLDMNMPGGGVSAVTAIALRRLPTRMLMLTVVDDAHQVSNAMRRGASGYLLKGTSSAELITAVRLVSQGQGYVSPTIGAKLLAHAGARPSNIQRLAEKFPELSTREEQVLSLITHGFSNRKIGKELGLSDKTVKGYVTTIMEKLGVSNRVEAAMLAADCRLEQRHPNS
jgi:two-component system nitrate/nitrite response regulator NarL